MIHPKQAKVIIRVIKFSTLAVSCLVVFNVQAAVDCSWIDLWNSSTAYTGGKQIQETNKVYKANWWSQGKSPISHLGAHQEWSFVDDCSTDNIG